MFWNSKPASLECAISFWSAPCKSWRLSFSGVELKGGTFGVVSWHGSGSSYGGLLKGRLYVLLRCLRLPSVRVFVSIVFTTSRVAAFIVFLVPCLLRLLHPHILALKSLVPIAAALPFTFIRWRHSKGQIWPALSHKGEAWILFDDLGPKWGQPTQC